LDIIGKGGFSKVWIVEVKKTKQKIALKMMSKARYDGTNIINRIISKKSVNSAMNEL
jgi:serine/threonine protein kinase